MEYIKWPSIESLKHVVKSPIAKQTLSCRYRAKVKIHGTNAAIRCFENTLVAQSRNRDIFPENDNAGFASWVNENNESLLNSITPGWAVFGEWFGPGIMKGVAASDIPEKSFAVFCLMSSDGIMITNPEDIKEYIDIQKAPKNMYIIPWYGDVLEINYEDPGSVRTKIESMLFSVEECDPFIESTFGVRGTGEGLVFYPLNCIDLDAASSLLFKVKGEKHSVKKTKQTVEIDSELLTNIDDFVDSFVTDARLEQCISELGITDLLPNAMSSVLKWMSQDILKESKDELQQLNLGWKDVSSRVISRVRSLYLKKCEI